MKSLMRKKGVLLLVLLFIIASATWYLLKANGQPVAYSTAEVKRGDLVITISATGTVEPEEVIDVGAQVAGQIVSFGKDKNGKTIDYGSTVEQGTILAQIDDSLYAADALEAACPAEGGQGRAPALAGRSGADESQASPGPERLGPRSETRPVGGPGSQQL